MKSLAKENSLRAAAPGWAPQTDTQKLEYRRTKNPPLLVVCDFDRVVVHTNFTNTPSEIYEVSLADIRTERGLEILRSVFHDPEKLRPGITSQAITAEAAQKVAQIARSSFLP